MIKMYLDEELDQRMLAAPICACLVTRRYQGEC